MGIDWWTTGNQILVAVICKHHFAFTDYLNPKDVVSLSQTSTSRHTDLKLILDVLRRELSLKLAGETGKIDGR
jgi:hypothetical protein